MTSRYNTETVSGNREKSMKSKVTVSALIHECFLVGLTYNQTQITSVIRKLVNFVSTLKRYKMNNITRDQPVSV